MYDIANGFTGLRSKHPTRCAAILCSLSTHLSFYSCKDVFLVIFAHRIHVLRTFTYIYCTYIYHKKKQLNVGKYIYIYIYIVLRGEVIVADGNCTIAGCFSQIRVFSSAFFHVQNSNHQMDPNEKVDKNNKHEKGLFNIDHQEKYFCITFEKYYCYIRCHHRMLNSIWSRCCQFKLLVHYPQVLN